jgi:hypothetical protein
MPDAGPGVIGRRAQAVAQADGNRCPAPTLIELIYRLALRGRSCGQIARSVNHAGWLTKPVRRLASPAPLWIQVQSEDSVDNDYNDSVLAFMPTHGNG